MDTGKEKDKGGEKSGAGEAKEEQRETGGQQCLCRTVMMTIGGS